MASEERKKPGSATAPPGRKPRRWKLRLGLFLLGLLAAAPTVLSLTGQTSALLAKLHPELGQALRFQHADLHWWLPIELREAQLRDLSGTESDDDAEALPLLSVRRIRTIEPLWRVLWQRGQDITLELESPVLRLRADASGSNLEDTLARLFPGQTTDESGAVPLAIRLRDGLVELASRQAASAPEYSAALRDIQGDFLLPGDTGQWPRMELSARLDAGSSPDQARQEPETDATATALALPGTFQVRLKSDAGQGRRTSVRLVASELDAEQLQPVWDLLHLDLLCRGKMTADIEAVSGGPQISDGFAARIQLQGHDVRVRRRDWVEAEWLVPGDVAARGSVAWARDGISVSDVHLTCDLGMVQGSGEWKPQPHAANVPAAAPSAPTGLLLEGHCDAARVATMLRRTIRLREDVRLTAANLRFGIRAGHEPMPAGDPSARSDWHAFVLVDQLRGTRAEQPVRWDGETRLDLLGTLRDGMPNLQSAEFLVPGGHLSVTPREEDHLVDATIDPQRLWQQFEQFSSAQRPDLTGPVQIQAGVRVDWPALRIRDLAVSSVQLGAHSEQLIVRMDQPIPESLSGTLHMDGEGAAVRTVLVPWHDASWLADDTRVVMHLTAAPDRGYQVMGSIQPLSGRSGPGSPLAESGVAIPEGLVIDEAELALELQAGELPNQFTILNGRLELPGLKAMPQGSVSFVNHDVRMDLVLATELDLDVLTRRLFPGTSEIRLTGTSRQTFRITGSTADWFTPTQVALANDVPRSLGVTPLKISGGIAWDSGQLCGFSLGPATLDATMERGEIRTQPFQCQVNGGDMHVMARYDLRTRRLELAPGSRITGMQLTSQLCRDWVGYAAPWLARSTDASGSVSVRVEQFDYGVDRPDRSVAQGVLSIHRAEATPDGALLAVLQTIDTVRSLGRTSPPSVVRSLELPPQEVPVSLRDGQITHESLLMDLADYRFRSSGQVGLDRSVRLSLEIPLEKRAGTEDYRSVTVPIGGTLDQLQPDTSGLLRGLGTQAVEDKVNRELDRQLNRLFDKLR